MITVSYQGGELNCDHSDTSSQEVITYGKASSFELLTSSSLAHKKWAELAEHQNILHGIINFSEYSPTEDQKALQSIKNQISTKEILGEISTYG